jgi:hypothetical protein
MTDGFATRFLLSLLFSVCAGTALAADPPAPPDDTPIPETTPPRLSLTEGAVSFWRPGADDWTAAQVNTALAAGDRLYADEDANLELQIGARAFVRAGEKTQVGIANIEPDFLQVEVTTGQASIDVRELDAGHTIEVGTPNAAFTIEHTGYYRVNVNGDTTTFITRRSGRALVTPEGGRAGAISPSEQVVVQGQSSPTVETYVAPDLDEWDRWNYARTDRLLDSMSARYVSPGIAGTADLDHYGSWRVVPSYGPVWIPRGVAPGWAPYSTGRWIMDPYYGWTWIDYSPWGWAPYHYGRWVYLDSYWGWAPGPVGVRTAYAPALVVFFGGDDWSIGLNYGGPAIGWFALGWGEPCYPWWGPSWYRYSPWWGGWHGHHHWHHKHHDHDHHGDHDDDDDDFHGDRDDHHHGIDDYDNARVPRSVSAERAEDFGRYGGGERRGRIDQFDGSGVEPIRGSIPARATPASLTPGAGGSGATRPPATTENRPVVATRAPRDPSRGLRNAGIPATSAPKTSPTRIVPAPPKGGRSGDSPQVSRPPFGTRGGNERQEPPAPPPYRGSGGSTRTSKGKPILVQPRASGSSPIMRPSSRPSSRPLTQPHVQSQAQPPSRTSLPYRSSSGSVSPRPSSAPPSVGSAPSRARPSPSVRTAPAPSPTSRSSSSGSGTSSSQQPGRSSVHSTPSPSGIGRSGSSLPGVPANRVFGGSGGKR